MFTQECLEGAACEATEFAMTVVEDGTADKVTIQSVSETLMGNGVVVPQGVFAFATTATAAHMLSSDDSGSARYSVHLKGPLAVVYQGTCEVQE